MKSTMTNRHELEAQLAKTEAEYKRVIRERARLIQSYDENMMSDEVESLVDSIGALDKSAAELQTGIKTLKGALKHD